MSPIAEVAGSREERALLAVTFPDRPAGRRLPVDRRRVCGGGAMLPRPYDVAAAAGSLVRHPLPAPAKPARTKLPRYPASHGALPVWRMRAFPACYAPPSAPLLAAAAALPIREPVAMPALAAHQREARVRERTHAHAHMYTHTYTVLALRTGCPSPPRASWRPRHTAALHHGVLILLPPRQKAAEGGHRRGAHARLGRPLCDGRAVRGNTVRQPCRCRHIMLHHSAAWAGTHYTPQHRSSAVPRRALTTGCRTEAVQPGVGGGKALGGRRDKASPE